MIERLDAPGTSGPGTRHADDAGAAYESYRSDKSWAQLWFAVQRHAWSTLAVVPADATADAANAARELVAAGDRYRGRRSVELIDATAIEPYEIASVVAAALDAAANAQVVVAVGSPLIDPSAIAIARALDASVLLVHVGSSRLSEAERAIDSIGREHFIGSATVGRGRTHPRGRPD